MKKIFTPLTDEYLKSLEGMQHAALDDYFYTRLKAKMERNLAQQGWGFKLKPVWVIGSLVCLLALNGFMLTQQYKIKQSTNNKTSPLQNFATAYDQTILSSY